MNLNSIILYLLAIAGLTVKSSIGTAAIEHFRYQPYMEKLSSNVRLHEHFPVRKKHVLRQSHRRSWDPYQVTLNTGEYVDILQLAGAKISIKSKSPLVTDQFDILVHKGSWLAGVTPIAYGSHTQSIHPSSSFNKQTIRIKANKPSTFSLHFVKDRKVRVRNPQFIERFPSQKYQVNSGNRSDPSTYSQNKTLVVQLKPNRLYRLKLRQQYQPKATDQTKSCHLQIKHLGQSKFVELRSPVDHNSWILGHQAAYLAGFARYHYVSSNEEKGSVIIHNHSNCYISLASASVATKTNAKALLTRVDLPQNANLIKLAVDAHSGMPNTQEKEQRLELARSVKFDDVYFRQMTPMEAIDDTVKYRQSEIITEEQVKTREHTQLIRKQDLIAIRPKPEVKVISFQLMNNPSDHHSIEEQLVRLNIGSPTTNQTHFNIEFWNEKTLLSSIPVIQWPNRKLKAKQFVSIDRKTPKHTNIVKIRRLSGEQWPQLALFQMVEREKQLNESDFLFWSKAKESQKRQLVDFLLGNDQTDRLHHLTQALVPHRFKIMGRLGISPQTSASLITIKQTKDLDSLYKASKFSYQRIGICQRALASRSIIVRDKGYSCLSREYQSRRDFYGLGALELSKFVKQGSKPHLSAAANHFKAAGVYDLSTLILVLLDSSETSIKSNINKLLIHRQETNHFIVSGASRESIINIHGDQQIAYRPERNNKLSLNILDPERNYLVGIRLSQPANLDTKSSWIRLSKTQTSIYFPLLNAHKQSQTILFQDNYVSQSTNIFIQQSGQYQISFPRHSHSGFEYLISVKSLDRHIAHPANGIHFKPQTQTEALLFNYFKRLYGTVDQLERYSNIENQLLVYLLRKRKKDVIEEMTTSYLMRRRKWQYQTPAHHKYTMIRDRKNTLPDSEILRSYKSYIGETSTSHLKIFLPGDELDTFVDLPSAQSIRLKIRNYKLETNLLESNQNPKITINNKVYPINLLRQQLLTIPKLSPGRHRVKVTFPESSERGFYTLILSSFFDGHWQPINLQPFKQWYAGFLEDLGRQRNHSQEIFKIYEKSGRTPKFSLGRDLHRLVRKSGESYIRAYKLVQHDNRPLPQKRLSSLTVDDTSRPQQFETVSLTETRTLYHSNPSQITLGTAALSECPESSDPSVLCSNNWILRQSLKTKIQGIDDQMNLGVSIYPDAESFLARADIGFKQTLLDTNYTLGGKVKVLYGKIQNEARLQGWQIQPFLERAWRSDNLNHISRFSLIHRKYSLYGIEDPKGFPLGEFSQWKRVHDAIAIIGHDTIYRMTQLSRLRSYGQVVSNTNKDSTPLDNLRAGVSYEALWSRNLSTSLGYEIRRFMDDRNRSRNSLAFGPQATIFWLVKNLPWGDSHIEASIRTDADSPNAVYLLGIETQLQNRHWPRSYDRKRSMLEAYLIKEPKIGLSDASASHGGDL